MLSVARARAYVGGLMRMTPIAHVHASTSSTARTKTSSATKTRKAPATAAKESTMKRSAPTSTKSSPKAKKAKAEIPEYHLTPSLRDDVGEIIWPAPKDQIDRARNFIQKCAVAGKKTLIVPDKDADGLSSGVILQKTLVLLGLKPELISAHLLQKGNNIHTESERQAMAAHKPEYIFVLDQGSRKAPPVIDAPHKALIIDHHFAEEEDFPAGAEHITACHSPPVATSSLLTYHLCSALHDGVQESCDWLCVLGTQGDLGTTLKWEPPFPDMRHVFKAHTKKALSDAVAMINAPRRTASFNVPAAWTAITAAEAPADLAKNSELNAVRAEVQAEVERCTHTAPKFSSDAKIAVFRINSAAQVHPLIATRWASHLSSAKLEVVLVANGGYLPGLVNFSCRIPRSARARDPPVNIIEVLKEVADRAPDQTLRGRLGESFARGHKEASGGIVGVGEFEELMACMEVGKKQEGASPRKKKKEDAATQSNTLMNYFGRKNDAKAPAKQ